MIYNDTAGKDGLLQNCESLANLGDAGISGNTILKAKFTSWLNQGLDRVASAILTVDKNWRWDDVHSYGNFSVATTNLVSGQRDYVLPRATNSADQSTLWKVYKVRLLDTNGNFYDLIPLASDADENDVDGRPTQYRLLGNSVRLSGPPLTGSLTLTAGIQVWFQRSAVKFTIGDPTKEPAFISGFHYLLPLWASATYLMPINVATANEYFVLFTRGIEDLKVSYATRNDDPRTTKRIVPVIEDSR